MMRFFIHTADAAFGELDGDNRGFSNDPTAAFRIVAAWNTDTGIVSMTVAHSYKSAYWATFTNGAPRQVPAETYPAHDIGPGLGNDLTLNSGFPSGQINATYTGLNGKLPVFAVDGTLNVVVGKDQMGLQLDGDAYPDFEAVQYRPHNAPRNVGTSNMGFFEGLNAIPFFADRHEIWLSPTH